MMVPVICLVACNNDQNREPSSGRRAETMAPATVARWSVVQPGPRNSATRLQATSVIGAGSSIEHNRKKDSSRLRKIVRRRGQSNSAGHRCTNFLPAAEAGRPAPPPRWDPVAKVDGPGRQRPVVSVGRLVAVAMRVHRTTPTAMTLDRRQVRRLGHIPVHCSVKLWCSVLCPTAAA